MAHPHLVALALLPHVLEQCVVARNLEEGAAEFAVIGKLDLAAQLRAHGLLAIADAEHRKAELEDFLGRPGTLALGHAGRAA